MFNKLLASPVLVNYIVLIPVILITITVHEYSKALTSSILGDTQPKKQGRLTLNPFKHFEPIGFILLMFFGYGWGKPVETSALFYKNRKKGTIITYSVPIIANLAAAIIFSIILKILTVLGYGNNYFVVIFFSQLVMYNVRLAVFNIIPISPLCGNRILFQILNPADAIKMNQYDHILKLLLMLAIVMRLLNYIIGPVVSVIYMILI